MVSARAKVTSVLEDSAWLRGRTATMLGLYLASHVGLLLTRKRAVRHR